MVPTRFSMANRDASEPVSSALRVRTASPARATSAGTDRAVPRARTAGSVKRRMRAPSRHPEKGAAIRLRLWPEKVPGFENPGQGETFTGGLRTLLRTAKKFAYANFLAV